jgi:outer membrane biosynthesis protein TonB
MLEVTLSKDGFLPMTATAGGSGSRVDLLQKLQPAPQESPPASAPKEPPLPKDAAAPKPTEPPVVKEIPDPRPKAAVHKAAKPVEKKTKPVGPRPASKLDEDDEPAPVDELKRPSP